MNAGTPRPDLAALVGASDPASTRLVYAMIFGLVLIGLAFIGLAIWLIRRTRVDPEVLAPLERMGDSAWLKRDSSTQRRLLDEVRPPGAVPLRAEPAAPTIDKEFDEQSQRPAASLSDLGPGVLPARDSTPARTADALDVPEADAIEVEGLGPEAAEPDTELPESVASEEVEPGAAEVEALEPDVAEPVESLEADLADPVTVDEPATETAG